MSDRPAGETAEDDLGTAVRLPAAPRRVVSLVPSLTEALAATDRAQLVGATDYCTHPADLDVARIGGSRFPDLDKVTALAPDLVLANAEETQPADIERLRRLGIPVWVTAPTTLAQAFGSLRRMLAACGHPEPAWLDQARCAWAPTYDGSPPIRTAIVPIWRKPWRVLGAGTFGGDVLRQLGIANAFDASPERYPKVDQDELASTAADLVVLPDEPYLFGPGDGPDAFPGKQVAYVSGRHLFWYGPSLAEARDLLERQLGGQP
jgi:ABC-type Fe3+-hydroxamate transport system substrate-binding protein